MEWLIANNPDYKHIKIDEEALKEYPVDTDHIQLPTVLEENDVVQDMPKEDGADHEIQKDKVKEKSVFDNDDLDEKSSFDNDYEDLLLAFEKYEEEQGDMPNPTHTVNENIANDTIDNYVKKAVEELQVGNDPPDSTEKLPWPEQADDEPVSDFTIGFFTKCFPHLFPDGMADISKSRPGNRPTKPGAVKKPS